MVATAKESLAMEIQQNIIEQEPNVINQDVIDEHIAASHTSSQLLSQLGSTVFSQMADQPNQSSVLSQQQGPLPDPAFIMSNIPSARPAPLTTNTKLGKSVALKKRKTTTGNKKSASAASKKKPAPGIGTN
ncbi:Os03g0648200 [Oryza sativa Japonica Group]|nr:hypothetical protein OsJ_11908 [Oryza sativa Japonica Group]BAS85489.1 Os03g0648200 [Oryza sativa Japonica Group]